MTIVANNLHGDYQLANGYGHNEAKKILKVLNVFDTFLFLKIVISITVHSLIYLVL